MVTYLQWAAPGNVNGLPLADIPRCGQPASPPTSLGVVSGPWVGMAILAAVIAVPIGIGIGVSKEHKVKGAVVGTAVGVAAAGGLLYYIFKDFS